jgi:two-component system, LytTR family, response regulator LytT
MSLHIAIIEDEPATARNLGYMLQDAKPDIQILNILGSIKDAVAWLKENAEKCDLLFMDIRLADGLSFEIIEQVKFKTPVIFVTAYNEYALNAFKANGIDYILKPFSEEAVITALEKFENLTAVNSNNYDRLINTIQQLRNNSNYKRALLVHYRDRLIPLNINDVHFFYSKNEILHAHTSDKQYITEGTLDKMHTELDPAQFFRANRQFIVNLNSIKEVHFYFNGRLLLKTIPEAPEQIIISKARVPEFKTWMNS